MTELLLGLLVGVLLATGTYLILQRGQIKLILGLGLISHGVNLALFGTGMLTRGAPDIIPHDENVTEYLATHALADPLPQALILTAIVISFGVTAFVVVLVSRRDALTGSDIAPGEISSVINTADPFGAAFGVEAALPEHSDDYDIFQYELDEVYDRPAKEVAHE